MQHLKEKKNEMKWNETKEKKKDVEIFATLVKYTKSQPVCGAAVTLMAPAYRGRIAWVVCYELVSAWA